jgi:hypothetical protein
MSFFNRLGLEDQEFLRAKIIQAALATVMREDL